MTAPKQHPRKVTQRQLNQIHKNLKIAHAALTEAFEIASAHKELYLLKGSIGLSRRHVEVTFDPLLKTTPQHRNQSLYDKVWKAPPY